MTPCQLFLSKQDKDARYLDTQRCLPRQRLEALEHVPIQQSGVQGYGAQSLYSDVARFLFSYFFSLCCRQHVSEC